MNDKFFISVSYSKIELNMLNCLFKKNVGAIYSFIGIVRDINDNKQVQSITYDVFKKLFISILVKKCHEFLEKTCVNVCVIQYCGNLCVGDINLLIGVSSTHRMDAFLCCSELVEFIKYKVPVWKKEFYCDGTYKWINT